MDDSTTSAMTPKEALEEAIRRAGGSHAALARAIRYSQPVVSDWVKAGQVSAKGVLHVELATGVGRHLLRPDLYPQDEKAA